MKILEIGDRIMVALFNRFILEICDEDEGLLDIPQLYLLMGSERKVYRSLRDVNLRDRRSLKRMT